MSADSSAEGGKALKGLFIGVSGVDAVFLLDGPLPAENEKIKTNDFYIAPGGPAAKASMTFARLSGSASLITCIGDSPLGGYLKGVLAEYGVTVKDIAGPSYSNPNVSAVLLRAGKSSRTLVSGQIPLDGVSFDSALSFDYDFCLYDCNLPALTPDIIAVLRELSIPLILDCGSWKENIEEALSYADIAISSSGFRSPEDLDIFALQEKYGIRLAARTNDGDPIEFRDRNSNGTVPVVKLDAGNTLGAGDVFHGAFCFYFYSRGCSFAEALENAAEYTGGYILEGSL